MSLNPNYHYRVAQEVTTAALDPSVQHLGITMPVGFGITRVIADLIDNAQLRDVLVIANERTLRMQLIESCKSQRLPRFHEVSTGRTRESLERRGDIPKRWDLAVIICASRMKMQDWWFESMTLIQNPHEAVQQRLHHHTSLSVVRNNHRLEMQLSSTTKKNFICSLD